MNREWSLKFTCFALLTLTQRECEIPWELLMTPLVNFNFCVYFSAQDWKYNKKVPSFLLLNSKQH